MPIKTISLELDAYEKLRRAKRGKESFSAVVRRGRFDAPDSTGRTILEEWKALYDGKRKPVGKAVLDYWDNVEREDQVAERISPSPRDE